MYQTRMTSSVSLNTRPHHVMSLEGRIENRPLEVFIGMEKERACFSWRGQETIEPDDWVDHLQVGFIQKVRKGGNPRLSW